MKASTLGRAFSKKAMEDRLGPYRQPGKSKKSPARREYRPRPITNHPATKRLWQRYMGLRDGKATLGTRAFRTFREFINAEALHDPLAMVMIIYQKKLINTLVGPGPKRHITAKPVIPDRKPRNNSDKGRGGRKH